jgi:hypothetical protein
VTVAPDVIAELSALASRMFEEGRQVGRQEVARLYYGKSAMVLTFNIFANALDGAATMLEQHDAEASARLREMAEELRDYAQPPAVATTSPAVGASDIALDDQVVVSFSRDLDPDTVTTDNMFIMPASGGGHRDATISYDTTSRTVTLVPATPLSPSVTYRVTVKRDVRSPHGVPMDADFVFDFTTAAA